MGKNAFTIALLVFMRESQLCAHNTVLSLFYRQKIPGI